MMVPSRTSRITTTTPRPSSPICRMARSTSDRRFPLRPMPIRFEDVDGVHPDEHRVAIGDVGLDKGQMLGVGRPVLRIDGGA